MVFPRYVTQKNHFSCATWRWDKNLEAHDLAICVAMLKMLALPHYDVDSA